MRNVLVIEDDFDIRDILAQVLRDEGFHVVTAANGEEGLAALRTHRPALILLDLMMPVMSGWQFREAQQADPDFKDIPVVIITADAHARHKAASLGAIGLLKKPIELDALLDTVHRYAV